MSNSQLTRIKSSYAKMMHAKEKYFQQRIVKRVMVASGYSNHKEAGALQRLLTLFSKYKIRRIKQKDAIVFITHEISRTGAPLALLRVLKTFAEEGLFDVILVVNKYKVVSQELYDAFSKVSKIYTYTVTVNNDINRMIREIYANYVVKGIYGNTICNGEIYPSFSKMGTPIITHVHELEYAFSCLSREELGLLLKYTTHYIVCTEQISSFLHESFGVSPTKIDVVSGGIDIREIKSKLKEKDRPLLRKKLGIKDNAFVVVGSGIIGWRKGTDLFLGLARYILHTLKVSNIYFVWVGGAPNGNSVAELAMDMRKSEIEHNVFFLGEMENPYKAYAAGDAFCLTSREDPMPLVCYEHAFLAKPMLCFAESGGAVDFIKKVNPRFVIAYADIPEMAKRILALMKEPAKAKQYGRAFFETVSFCYIENIAARTKEIINRFI